MSQFPTPTAIVAAACEGNPHAVASSLEAINAMRIGPLDLEKEIHAKDGPLATRFPSAVYYLAMLSCNDPAVRETLYAGDPGAGITTQLASLAEHLRDDDVAARPPALRRH